MYGGTVQLETLVPGVPPQHVQEGSDCDRVLQMWPVHCHWGVWHQSVDQGVGIGGKWPGAGDGQ